MLLLQFLCQLKRKVLKEKFALFFGLFISEVKEFSDVKVQESSGIRVMKIFFGFKWKGIVHGRLFTKMRIILINSINGCVGLNNMLITKNGTHFSRSTQNRTFFYYFGVYDAFSNSYQPD